MESRITIRGALTPALQNAVQLWAEARTDLESPRREHLLRDKTRTVGDFFQLTGKHPGRVMPLHATTWTAHLEDQELAPATIYHRLSLLSSWYRWALSDGALREAVKVNPVELARPKAPKAYHESQALADETLRRLLAAVPRDTLTGLRDYALLLWYLLTGHRRAEVCRLRWGDLAWEGEALTVRFLVKGGDYATEVVNPLYWEALRSYLAASGRLEVMEANTRRSGWARIGQDRPRAPSPATPLPRTSNATPGPRASRDACTSTNCATASPGSWPTRRAPCPPCKKRWATRIAPLPVSTSRASG